MFEELEEGRYLTLQGLRVSKYKPETKLGRAFQFASEYVKLPEVTISLGVGFAAAAFSQDFAKVALFRSIWESASFCF